MTKKFAAAIAALNTQLVQTRDAQALQAAFEAQIRTALSTANLTKRRQALRDELEKFARGETDGYFLVGAVATVKVETITEIETSDILRKAVAAVIGTQATECWKIGDDKATVLRIQGAPRSVQPFDGGDWFYYGKGDNGIVKFDTDGKVVGYNNYKGRLHVRG